MDRTGLNYFLFSFVGELKKILPSFGVINRSFASVFPPGAKIIRRDLEETYILFKLVKFLEFSIANSLEDTEIEHFEGFETRYIIFQFNHRMTELIGRASSQISGDGQYVWLCAVAPLTPWYPPERTNIKIVFGFTPTEDFNCVAASITDDHLL